MEKRIGTAIIVLDTKDEINKLNQILSGHSEIIIGRQGISLRERGKHIISIVLEGSTDEIGSLTGKLGRLSGIRLKSALVRNENSIEEKS